MFKHLKAWVGVKHQFSITDMHTNGNFVLFDTGSKPYLKLSCRYKGPYEVMKLSTIIRMMLLVDILLGFVVTLDVESLIIYVLSREKAYGAALRYSNQFVIDEILKDRGNPYRRTSIDFLIRFADGGITWVPYSKEWLDSISFASYVSRFPHLYHLRYTEKEEHKRKVELSKQPITTLQLGEQYNMYGLHGWDMTL
jgi:hypothetical protein